ncbi:hypothetical protein V5P93_002091 [Actinokineospora auranticolor]|uniref:DUF600 family protein n=1 Tax=Actinokineospora auranticolor TaxID=155976 RepID=A0A2S6GDC7_9PSEU|nr:hypothetical protein [Actinokineospora auranticolor]PPK63265.1 hypothetical protein CLV40_13057 [Actinokineospora auranticolor]
MTGNQPFGPVEQQALVAEIAGELAKALPQGWGRLIIDARMLGRHNELAIGLRLLDGSFDDSWSLPEPIWHKFQDLRYGMYTPGLGTWLECSFILDPPMRFQVNYNRDEPPKFTRQPTKQDFETEARWHPRADEHTPDWLRAGLEGSAE